MSGFSFGNPAPAPTSAFGAPATSTAGFSFGAPSTTSTPAPLAFGGLNTNPSVFSAQPTASVANTFGTPAATSTAATAGFATSAVPATAPAFGVFGNSGKSITSNTGANNIFGTTWTTAGGTGTTAPGMVTSQASTQLQGGFSAGFSAPATGQQQQQSGNLTTGPTGQMTFEELEKRCNEWKKELDRQEESFLKRATQINAWDRLITANSEKITELNDYMKKVKSDQERLDRELDFVEAQQTELEEMLVPLEKQAEAMNTESIQNHADVERESTYHAAGKVNLQLQTMADTIKDIIERINASNRSSSDESPMELTSRILNMHMDALQTIQTNIGSLQEKIEDVNKLMGVARI